MAQFGELQRLESEIAALRREITELTGLVNGLAGQIAVLGLHIAPPTPEPDYVYGKPGLPYPQIGHITFHTPEDHANTSLHVTSAQGPYGQQPQHLREVGGPESRFTDQGSYPFAQAQDPQAGRTEDRHPEAAEAPMTTTPLPDLPPTGE